jgi:hypothetical protein
MDDQLIGIIDRLNRIDDDLVKLIDGANRIVDALNRHTEALKELIHALAPKDPPPSGPVNEFSKTPRRKARAARPKPRKTKLSVVPQ